MPLLIIVGFFAAFFWPAVFAGRYFVYGDSLVYQYPLRIAAWDMIRHGMLPLWTPHILSGYPMLAMTTLALPYPLTWGYLFLPGHAAEHVYVLAPFLLAPTFTYAYLRTVGRSRPAALLGGLTFAYGGMMAGLLANTGAHSNAAMWHGHTIERTLRAGLDSADAAHEHLDVKASMRHDLARIFDGQSGPGSFRLYRYWTQLDLGRKTPVARVELTNVTPSVPFALWRATLYDTNANTAVLLTQALPAQWHKVYDQDDVLIYQNERAMPRAWLVPHALPVSAEDALRGIRGETAQGFRPRDVALLEPAEHDAPTLPLPEGQFATEPVARIVRYEPAHLILDTEADRASVLVVSEIWYPGWTATIDGHPTTIFATNYLLRGVVLSTGKHRVEMRYVPAAWRLALSLSAGTFLLMVAMFLKTRTRA